MPQAPYSYVTLGQAAQELANRLYDSGMVFWSQAELTAYITEALRTWNALTAYWRDDFTFQSLPGATWYDLHNTTVMPNTLVPLTVTDANLYTVMEYHLLEPAPATNPINPWTGSQQFTADDFLNAVQRRRDETL